MDHYHRRKVIRVNTMIFLSNSSSTSRIILIEKKNKKNDYSFFVKIRESFLSVLIVVVYISIYIYIYLYLYIKKRILKKMYCRMTMINYNRRPFLKHIDRLIYKETLHAMKKRRRPLIKALTSSFFFCIFFLQINNRLSETLTSFSTLLVP